MIIEARIELPLSSEHVFVLLTNPKHFHSWMEGFVERKPLGGNDGEVGCVASFTRKTNGLSFVFKEEIMEVRSPISFSVNLLHKDLEILAAYKLSPMEGNDGCILSVTHNITPRALSMRMALGMMKNLLEKQLQSDLMRFRELVRGGAI